jgi:hypothetical protein
LAHQTATNGQAAPPKINAFRRQKSDIQQTCRSVPRSRAGGGGEALAAPHKNMQSASIFSKTDAICTYARYCSIGGNAVSIDGCDPCHGSCESGILDVGTVVSQRADRRRNHRVIFRRQRNRGVLRTLDDQGMIGSRIKGETMLLETFQVRDALPFMPPPLVAPEVVLRHLKDSSEIGAVQRLRQEIDLAVHARLNPFFHTDEKKETTSEFPSLSS